MKPIHPIEALGALLVKASRKPSQRELEMLERLEPMTGGGTLEDFIKGQKGRGGSNGAFPLEQPDYRSKVWKV